MHQEFWIQWQNEYLSTRWPLARVTHVHPGADGLVTAVTIKLADTELTRPIHKLKIVPTRDSEIQ